MANEKIEFKFDFLPVEKVIEVTEDTVHDNMYKLKRAKTRQAKKGIESSLQFFGTVGYYFKIIKSMTDEEFIQAEQNYNLRQLKESR
ncbi:hypothetical protein [Cecembia rubra]|uniref:Uncharacterized protein n=1 Tax=Cecembia rubra TaxID=1485585 RepID=A0A2P8EAR1_9BACT|nr:hypothetical protein [Cecembia rubra]PSL06559.1 hypothetical protein CLV48_102376 [Cecembia rubra]